VCPPLADAAASRGWLVCPLGDARCDNGGYYWTFVDSQRFVARAVDELAAAFPGRVARTRGTLAGFSWGAIVATDVANRSHGEWSRLVLLGADVTPDADRLARAGVSSIVMGAGDFDMMNARMREASSRLERRGLRAAFFTFGPVGHAFAHDMPGWASRAFAWLDDFSAS
jgi:predicted esterase